VSHWIISFYGTGLVREIRTVLRLDVVATICTLVTIVIIMQASGAYIFRPNSSDTYPMNNDANKANITVAMVSVYYGMCW